jgi:hypothetical protein
MATVHTEPWLETAVAELHDLGFDTGVNEHGWFAFRERGPYRTRIVSASSGWRVINTYTPNAEVVAYEPRATQDKAIECAIQTALSVDALVELAGLLTLEVKAELRRTA